MRLNSEQRRRLILTIYLIAVASILAIDHLAIFSPAEVEEALVFISDTDSIDASRQSNSAYRIRPDGGGMKRVVGSIPHGDGYLRIADIDCHRPSQSLMIASHRPDLNGFHHARLDGSGLHLDRPAAGEPLTSLRHIALAPDGLSVIASREYAGFSQPRFGLVAGDLGRREFRKFKAPTADRSYHSPAWSPDGRQIAYIAEESIGDARPAYRLVLARSDGDDERIVYQTTLALADFAWSPDGQWLALEMSRQIYKLRPDGSGLTQLSKHTGGAAAPRWSPDGARVSFVAASSFPGFKQILVMDADGGNIQQVANIRGEALNGCWV